MKRDTFLKFFLGAGLLSLNPFRLKARTADKGFFVANGNDRYSLPLTRQPGDLIYNTVSTADTDGDLYIFDTTRIKKGGPPLHYHFDQDEWWYVITGEFLIRVGDETWHAKAGDSVFGPRGVPHTFAKISEGEAKIILLFQPAGKMEDFFKALDSGKLEGMSDEEKAQFRIAHGFKHAGPPITVPD